MKRVYQGVIFFLFIYLFFIQLEAIWPFTIDDMFISLRYAKNWASGSGLLWNIDAPPVEGYSNFSFVVLAAGALKLHLDPLPVLKLAGCLGLFFTTYFVYGLTRFWFERAYACLPAIILLLYKGQIIWSVSGLETTVYEALICASVFYCFKGLGYQLVPLEYRIYQPRAFLGAGFLLALAGLTRPEAPVLMALFLTLIFIDRIKTKNSWKGLIFFLLPLIFLYTPYFLWRWYYYESFLPNAIYCKGFVSQTFLLDINYIKLAWPFIILSLYAFWKKQDLRYYFLALPSIFYLVMLIGADPIVAFENRLFLTAFALILPLAWVGIGDILLLYSGQKTQVWNFCLLLVTLYIGLFFIPKNSLSAYSYFKEGPLEGEALRNKVVNWLNTHLTAKQAVVLADAGYIPFAAPHLNFIDSYCLNNRTMREYPAKHRYEKFCQTILDQKPKVIILTSLLKQNEAIYTPADICLKNKLNSQDFYKLAKVFNSQDQEANYRYELFTY